MQTGKINIESRLSAATDVYFFVDSVVAESAMQRWREYAQGSHWLIKNDSSKDLGEVEKLWRWLHEQGATRHSLLVCVGGGTVTDLGGFAAATFKRGIPYINVPTTLLAMVDASTGGKTGFDFAGVKNEIGSFYSPLDTYIEPSWLDTLPSEEFLSGYAEMIKHALVADKEEYTRLLGTGLSDDIERKILTSIRIKRQVIESDPYEKGLRKILNFGHTIGHALEAYSHQQDANNLPLRHGYAVMQGLVAELYLSVTEQNCNREVLRQMSHFLVEYYGRPSCRCSDYESLLQLMRADKKNTRYGEISFTLLSDVGQPVIDQVLPDIRIKEALDYLFSL